MPYNGTVAYAYYGSLEVKGLEKIGIILIRNYPFCGPKGYCIQYDSQMIAENQR